MSTLTQSSRPTEQTTVLWITEIAPQKDYPDRAANEVLQNAVATGLLAPAESENLNLSVARGFLVQGTLSRQDIESLGEQLLCDQVVETFSFRATQGPSTETDDRLTVHVLPKPGVTDTSAESVKKAMVELGYNVEAVQTFKRYTFSTAQNGSVDPALVERIARKLLANDSVEQTVFGQLHLDRIDTGSAYRFVRQTVEIRSADDDRLQSISRDGQLSLSLIEMQTIAAHYRGLGRDPSDIELETIAQTWSEHCSHKTLAGRIDYTDENGTRQFDNMLKETIFAATQTIRADLGDDDWCVSVFKDNAGIVKFVDGFNLTFKVETHNRPSALEPYGGANTGIGGVIRDTLGTGLGAKPICNTDVFCFADPNTPADELPPGVLHPRRIINGVVAGVRDYGNRMGIPTVNGAVYFDQRYVGNPLVFCGNVGLIPHERSEKQPQPGDLIVAIGGRTGRDGIHGATFSSAELTDASEVESGGAVQIGNAITEKTVADVLFQAADENLFNAVTDCGAGGFSSAVGEMAEGLGADVHLERAPLKYSGLSYTEIWISEAQERMVFSVPPENWQRFLDICTAENVEAIALGTFNDSGQLRLHYEGELVGDLNLELMHDGRPHVIRQATYQPSPTKEFGENAFTDALSPTDSLKAILSSHNVASKHWIIRQYDHEVQGGSVIKPLVGVNNDGPGDAAVIRPILPGGDGGRLQTARKGVAISCGMNPYYGDIDTYHMAASGIDEAIRNCVAVGANPNRIAILDNFCWGHTDRPETLGSLVRAAIACQDLATVLQTPFISGKDSLHNEFSYDSGGTTATISIPATLLISAMGQVDDVSKCVTMDFKRAGNEIFLVGTTGAHLGGSHFSLVNDSLGTGEVPTVDPHRAKNTFGAVHAAISNSLVAACHDLSEGGLAVALAEMCFAGGLGASVDVGTMVISESVTADEKPQQTIKLFSESNSRFLCEVPSECVDSFVQSFSEIGVPVSHIGQVQTETVLKVVDSIGESKVLIETPIAELKAAWQQPLDWD